MNYINNNSNVSQEQNDKKENEGGFRGQVKLLKRLLSLQFEELLICINIDTHIVNNEKQWKLHIEQLKNKMEIHYHKSVNKELQDHIINCIFKTIYFILFLFFQDRAIQIEFMGNLFLFNLKYGLQNIKKDEMLLFLKERISGKPSIVRSKAVVLVICLLIIEVNQSFNEDTWLQVSDETIEQIIKYAPIILEEAQDVGFEKLRMMYGSKLMTSVCLLCFINKNQYAIQTLEISMQMIQKLQALKNLTTEERQEYQFLLINLMKKYMKQAIQGRVKNSYQVVQNALKYISEVKQYWQKLQEIQNADINSYSNEMSSPSHSLLHIQKAQSNLLNYQSFLNKVQQVENEIISQREKAGQKYLQSLRKQIIQSSDGYNNESKQIIDGNLNQQKEETSSQNNQKNNFKNNLPEDRKVTLLYRANQFVMQSSKNQKGNDEVQQKNVDIDFINKTEESFIYENEFNEKNSSPFQKRIGQIQTDSKKKNNEDVKQNPPQENQNQFKNDPTTSLSRQLSYNKNQFGSINSKDDFSKSPKQTHRNKQSANNKKFSQEGSPFHNLLQEKQVEDLNFQSAVQQQAQPSSRIFHKANSKRFSYFSQIQNDEVHSEFFTLSSLNKYPTQKDMNLLNQLQIQPCSQQPQQIPEQVQSQTERAKSHNKNKSEKLKTEPDQKSKEKKITNTQRQQQYHFQNGRGGAVKTKSDQEERQKQSINSNKSTEFDIQLEILKKSISLAKKQAFKTQEQEIVDSQNDRTRKSTITSTQTYKEKGSPITYLSSPQSNYFFSQKPYSVLQKYHFSYRDKFQSHQYADLNDLNLNGSTKPNSLLEYFGTSKFNGSQELDTAVEIQTQAQTQRSYQTSPQVRTIQSARGYNQSPLIKNRVVKQKKQNNKISNSYFVGNVFSPRTQDKQRQENKTQQNSTPIDIMMTQSINTTISPLLTQRSNTQNTQGFIQFKKRNSIQVKNVSDQFQQKEQKKNDSQESNRRHSTLSQHSDKSPTQNVNEAGERRLNTERFDEIKNYNKAKGSNLLLNTFMKNSINTILSGKQTQPIDKYQNLRLLNENQVSIESEQIISEKPANQLQEEVEKSIVENKQTKKNIQKDSILNGKPQLRNILNQINCEKKEQIFLKQMEESVRKTERSYNSQPASPLQVFSPFGIYPIQNQTADIQYESLNKRDSINSQKQQSQIQQIKILQSQQSFLFQQQLKLQQQYQLQQQSSELQQSDFQIDLQQLQENPDQLMLKRLSQNDNNIVSLNNIDNFEDPYIALNIQQAQSIYASRANDLNINSNNNKQADSIQHSITTNNSVYSRMQSLKTKEASNQENLQSQIQKNMASPRQSQQIQQLSQYQQKGSPYIQLSKHAQSQVINNDYQLNILHNSPMNNMKQRASHFIKTDTSNQFQMPQSNNNPPINMKSHQFQYLLVKSLKKSIEEKKSSTNQDIPSSILPESQSQIDSNQKMQDQGIIETTPKRNLGISKKQASRIQEDSSFRMMIKETLSPIQSINQQNPSSQSNNTTIGQIYLEPESSKSRREDLKQEAEQKLNISELQDKGSVDASSPKSDQVSIDIKSPLSRDQEVHQSFLDYINKQKGQKSQFASSQRLLFEENIEQMNKLNQSILMSKEGSHRLSQNLPKSMHFGSPKGMHETQIIINKKDETSPAQSLFKKVQSTIIKNDSIRNSRFSLLSENVNKISQSLKQSDQLSVSKEQKPILARSSFLQVPITTSQQQRGSLQATPTNKQDQLSMLKNISRSFKIPQWAEQNQKKFPSYFNMQLNGVQKKLFNITECFKVVFIFNKFMKKTLKKVRENIRKRKEQQQNEEQKKNELQRMKQKKTSIDMRNSYRTLSLHNKKRTITQSIEIQNGAYSAQVLSVDVDTKTPQNNNSGGATMTKEQFELMQIFRLKQFKERTLKSSLGMNQQDEPLDKFIGYYPTIKFFSFIGGSVQTWKVFFQHPRKNRLQPRKSFMILEKKQRSSMEKTDQSLSQMNEFQFIIKIDHQINKFNFKLNQNIINLLPSSNQLCSTLWPSSYWLFRHNLQTEKNFILDDQEYYQHGKKQSELISAEQQNQKNDNEDLEERLLCQYDNSIIKAYHNQNQFLGFKTAKSKKFFQMQDFDYIGKLSNLLQQYANSQGRVISKINGKAIVFAEKPYNQSTISCYRQLLSLIKRYQLYISEKQQDNQIEQQQEQIEVVKEKKDHLQIYSSKIKLSSVLVVRVQQYLFNLKQEQQQFLVRNENVFNNYFTFMQKQHHHILNFFLKKKGQYFLTSVNIVFKYDLCQRYFQDKKIPFSIYIMAKNMDLNSRVKPIEISEDKFHFFFSEESFQHEIKRQIIFSRVILNIQQNIIRFLFRGTLSKFWKMSLIRVCSQSIEVINNSQKSKQLLKPVKFGYYDQELYIKDSMIQMNQKNQFCRTIGPNGQIQNNYQFGTDNTYQQIGLVQNQQELSAQQSIEELEQLFEKNFDDIYDRFFIQKREKAMNYNEINTYNSSSYQIKNDFDLNQDRFNESDEEEQGRNIPQKVPNLSLPKEVFIENEVKYDYEIQTNSQIKMTQNFYKKFMERLKDFQKQKGRFFIMKNKYRGVNFILQILSDRNHINVSNRLRSRSTRNVHKQKIYNSIDCFIYDYERKARYFISLKEKKQIRLLLNVIEMNLEGFLMENQIVKLLQSTLLQEILVLQPSTQRHISISPFLKSNTRSQREKKLRVDDPLSIMYHLLVDSKQIENYYHCINRNYILPFRELGKCYASLSMYYIRNHQHSSIINLNEADKQDEETGSHHKLQKEKDNSSKRGNSHNSAFKFSILLQFHIMPVNQRYKAYRFILSLADLHEIDALMYKHLQKKVFQESMIQRIAKLMSNQFTKVRTNIGTVLAISPDRVQTIHSTSGKKLILRLNHFHSYQDNDSIVDGTRKNSIIISKLRADSIDSQPDKSEILSPEEVETLTRIENRKWRLFIKSLKYSKNKVLKHDFSMNDTVYKKRLMYDIIEQRRIILQRTQKFFDREYTIITVLRDILKNIYVIQLYIPKTCRTIQISFSDENLNDVNPQFINQWLQQKLLFFHQNSQIPPFSSFLFFSQRINATNKHELKNIYENESKQFQIFFSTKNQHWELNQKKYIELDYFSQLTYKKQIKQFNNIFIIFIEDEVTKKSIFSWQKINMKNQKRYESKVPEYGIGTPKSSMRKSSIRNQSKFGNSEQRTSSEYKKVEFGDDYSFSSQSKTLIEQKRSSFKRSTFNRSTLAISPEYMPKKNSQIKRNLAELLQNKMGIIKNKPTVIIEYFKTPELQKAEKLKNLDQAFKKRSENLKLSHMTRFIEMQIWTNILNDLYFLPNDLKKDIMIMIGDSSFQVHELLHHENLNVDGKQDIQIEISIDLIQSISRPYLIKMRKQHQENTIPYSQMSPTQYFI